MAGIEDASTMVRNSLLGTRPWRPEFTESDVRMALAAVGIHGWRHTVWSDGTMTIEPSKDTLSMIELEAVRMALRPDCLEVVAVPPRPGAATWSARVLLELTWLALR